MKHIRWHLFSIIFAFICTPFLFAFSKQVGHKHAPKKTHKSVQTYIIKDPVLKRLVKRNEALFAIYDTLSPFDHDYDLRKFHLSPKQLPGISNANTYLVDGSTLIEYYKSEIHNNLKKILSYKTIYRYNLQKLLGSEKGLGVSVSPDGKLYCLNYDQKTGGSYRSVVSIMHYRSNKRVLYNSFNDDQSGDNNSNDFDSDGYYIIDTIHTKQGIKYLLQGSVAGCNTCVGEYILLTHFSHGKFLADFADRVETRGDLGDSSAIAFDPKEKTITIDYMTSDLSPECECAKKKADSLNNNSDTTSNDSISITKCHCLYRFDGETFVAVK